MKILYHIPFSVVDEAAEHVASLVKDLSQKHDIMVTYEHAELEGFVNSMGVMSKRVFSPNTVAALIMRFFPDIIQFYHSGTAYKGIKKARTGAIVVEAVYDQKYLLGDIPGYPRDYTDIAVSDSYQTLSYFGELFPDIRLYTLMGSAQYDELYHTLAKKDLPPVQDMAPKEESKSPLLIKSCICGGTNFKSFEQYNLSLASCLQCGVIHQKLEMTKDKYFEFYEKQYPAHFQNENKRSTYKDRYEHDKNIARMRLEKYASFIPSAGKILDIGASNGAFIHTAKERGYDACGVDMNPSECIYKGPLEAVNFPTEYFDVITIHDVLEHLIDPVASLKEVRRILKPGGRLIVDFPNYFEDSGKHHWKPIEHLWYLDKKQLTAFLEKEGFGITEVDQPIPSKLVFYCYNTKSIASKTKILVLPGMGDIYWTLTKLQSFMEQRKIVLPEVYIWNFDGRPRSLEFLRKFPFLKAAGYWNEPADQRVLKDTYATGKAWVIPKYREFDYYISVNGVLTDGNSLETIKECKTNWYVPMFEALDQRDFGKSFRVKHGKYVVAFFSELGMFAEWIKAIPIAEVYSMMRDISVSTKNKIVLTGCEWDKEFNQKLIAMDKAGIFVDMIGKTTNDQFFSLVKESKGFIGWCGGNTVMSVVMKVPTIIFWSKGHFKNEGFYTNCCPPEGVDKWYFPQVAELYDRKKVQSIAAEIFK